MHRYLLLRFIGMLLLATVPMASALVALPVPVVVADEDGNDQGENGNKTDNRGNPGNNGNNRNSNKDKPGKNGNDKNVKPIEGYTVDVTCEYDADAGQTTCEVLATAPAEGKKIGFVQVPSSELCADVIETEAEYVDDDPHTHLAGYKSRGNDRGFTLILDGEVTASGTAEYWIKAANNVFPVSGPGMECPESVANTDEAENSGAVSTATEVPTTGELVVKTYECGAEPENRADFDWFGECQPAASSYPYTLDPAGDTSGTISAESDAAGEVTFPDLAGGNWWLELDGGMWCHANSDKVTSDGELVIDPGEATTVWVFLCEGKAA